MAGECRYNLLHKCHRGGRLDRISCCCCVVYPKLEKNPWTGAHANMLSAQAWHRVATVVECLPWCRAQRYKRDSVAARVLSRVTAAEVGVTWHICCSTWWVTGSGGRGAGRAPVWSPWQRARAPLPAAAPSDPQPVCLHRKHGTMQGWSL